MESEREFAFSILNKWMDDPSFITFVFRGQHGETFLEAICFVKDVDERGNLVRLVSCEDSFLTISLDLSGARFESGDERVAPTEELRELIESKFSWFVGIRLATGGSCLLAECKT